MRTKKYKILVLLLAILTCFTLTACNFSGNSVLDIATQNGLDSTKSETTETPQTTNVTEYNTTVNRETTEINLYDTYLDLKAHGNYSGTFADFLKEFLNNENGISTDIEYASNKGLMSAVSVYASFTSYFFPYSNYTSSGAGVFYSIDKMTGDALIITNYHVVFDNECNTSDGISSEIVCYTYGQMEGVSTPLTCTFLGGSMEYDIAVLKVTASEKLKNDDSMAITFADSNEIIVGEPIVAIGNPESDGISATTGIICVDSEHITAQSTNGTSSTSHRVMRIDAAVNSGNSGGGIFNRAGQLIGIANAKLVDSSVDNIAYAIPSNVVKYITEAIIRQCNGTSIRTIKRAILGVEVKIVETSSYYDGQKAEIVNTIIISSTTAGALADGILTLNSVVNKIAITDNSNTYNPITTEYNVTRLFHIEAILQAKVGDTVTFYTSDADGNPLEPKTITITSDCFIDVN